MQRMTPDDAQAPATKDDIRLLMEQIGQLFDATAEWKGKILGASAQWKPESAPTATADRGGPQVANLANPKLTAELQHAAGCTPGGQGSRRGQFTLQCAVLSDSH
jgi:hypothetical protein